MIMKGKKMKCCQSQILRNEKGIALATVLILSLISLAIIATLISLVLQGTRFSGAFKRYETAREAGVGGAALAGALISERGNLVITGLVNLPNACDCGDPLVATDNRNSLGVRTCLCDKLCDPPYTGGTNNWTSCTNGTTMEPTDYPDMASFNLSGIGGSNYQVSVKIVDTVRGNSDLSTEQLGGTGVASSSSSIITAPPMPYLYRMEINSQAASNPLERSRLSVLYAF